MTKREFDDRTKGLIHTDCDECVRKAKRQWIHSQEEKGKGWQEQSDLKEKRMGKNPNDDETGKRSNDGEKTGITLDE